MLPSLCSRFVTISHLAPDHPVGAFGLDPDDEAAVADHGGPVIVPVGVLALHKAVQLDQLLDRLVVRVARDRGQFGMAVGYGGGLARKEQLLRLEGAIL